MTYRIQCSSGLCKIISLLALRRLTLIDSPYFLLRFEKLASHRDVQTIATMVSILANWLSVQEEIICECKGAPWLSPSFSRQVTVNMPSRETLLPPVRPAQQDDYFVVRPLLRKQASSQRLLRGPSPTPATPSTAWNMPAAKTSGFAQYLPLSLSMRSSNQSQFSQFSQFLSRDRQGSDVSIFPTDIEGEDRLVSLPTTANLRRSTKSPNRSASPRDRRNLRAQIFNKTMESASPDIGSQLVGRSLPLVTETPGSVAMTKQASRVTFDPASPENKTGRYGTTTAFHRPNRLHKKIDWHVRAERDVPAFEYATCFICRVELLLT